MTENDAWNRAFISIEEISTWQSQFKITNKAAKNKSNIANKLDEKNENQNINEKIATKSKLDIDNYEFDCKRPKFYTDVEINSKFCISSENPALIKSDVIVVPINQFRSMKTSVSFQVYKIAGSDFGLNLEKIEDLSNCDVIQTPSCNLSTICAIHVLEPTHIDQRTKYQNSTDNAIHYCYKNALDLARKLKLRNVTLLPLFHCECKDLYFHLTNVAIRTFRCYLNCYSNDFDRLVYTIPEYKLQAVTMVATVYFPRNTEEFDYSKQFEPESSCETLGACKSQGSSPISNIKYLNLGESPDEKVISKLNNLDFHKCGPTNHDRYRRYKMMYKSDQSKFHSQQRVYIRLLREAKLSKLSVATENYLKEIISFNTTDIYGNMNVVITPCLMNKSVFNSYEVIKYILRNADEVVNKSYNIVYFCSNANHHITADFLKRLQSIVDRRYCENINKIIVVHPTFMQKVYCLYFTTFYASEFRKKLLFIKSLSHLHSFINQRQLEFHQKIIDYDYQLNPHLYQVMTT